MQKQLKLSRGHLVADSHVVPWVDTNLSLSLHCDCFSCFCTAHLCAFSALTLSVGQQEGHLACKKTECWRGCLSGATQDLHIAQLMSLPLTVSCFSKIQIGFPFLVPAHPDCPGQRAVRQVCVSFMCRTQRRHHIGRNTQHLCD